MMSEEANCDQSTDTKTEQTDTPSQPTDAELEHKVLSVEDWTEKYWKAGNTGFHKDHVNTLADKGHTVIGIEVVEQAILEFFTEQNLDYTKETLQDIDGEVYKTSDGKIRIYKCDFLDFNRSLECDIGAVWDRGAFVAINCEDRERYVSVIKSVASSDCRMLVATLDYDPTLWPGPPHYMTDETVAKIYGGDEYSTEVLARQDSLTDRWRSRGLSSFFEVLHFLKKKTS